METTKGYIGFYWGIYWGYIGIMDKNLETTTMGLYRCYTGKLETQMKTTLVHWDYIGNGK